MKKWIRELLHEKARQYNSSHFIIEDPISIPHQFSKKEDVEISGFLTATIAWGQRKTILNSARRIMNLMDDAPHDFIRNHQPQDRQRFKGFVHRTFNEDDLIYFVHALQEIYRHYGNLENAFAAHHQGTGVYHAITGFRRIFFEPPHLSRTEKHVSNPAKNSACKRLNMFLRWMVRRDQKGVDFGIWDKIKPSDLSCPLDVHSSYVARQLGLIVRKQNDWKAVQELDQSLRKLNPEDPVIFDFALFGLGVYERVSLERGAQQIL